jgi:hypothetical protein
MKRYPQKVELCLNCGFVMEAVVETTNLGRLPQEGDVSICAECAMLYKHKAGVWQGATMDDLLALPPEMIAQFLTLRTIVAARSGRTSRSRHRGGPIQ